MGAGAVYTTSPSSPKLPLGRQSHSDHWGIWLLPGRPITGISTTFSGLTGCCYILQAGVPTTFAAERVPGKPDSRGK